MQKFVITISLLGLFTTGQPLAHQQTEIYIPIGESPGLSNTYTDVGRIQDFHAGSRTLSLAAKGGTRPVQITSDTRIWLDRAGARLRNTEGGESDLVSGRRAEVKYVDSTKRQTAAWVKVEIAN